MLITGNSQLSICLALTNAIGKTSTAEEIYAIALDALETGLGAARASILLFDADGVMRFTAHRRLSDSYRRAVEGHTPWAPETPDAEPIVVSDVVRDPSLAPLLPIIQAEGIAALVFIPLISRSRVIGKFMVYYDTPVEPTAIDLELARVIASQVAFAVERTHAEERARRGEERLRFALDAASMGTWEWDLARDTVRWSENLERIHGLPPGTFDGTFASYEREIHPQDRPRVLASAQRAIAEGVPHEVEYRIVAPDGTVRWVEGKGIVEYEHGTPVRMSGVCMMVTRRKEAELARLADAEEASRQRDEFLAGLSHELRTPLNAILGWVQMLQGGKLSPERMLQAIEIIGRNAKLQTQLIEDILDVSRIIAGKLDIERLPILVPQLIETVVNGILPTVSAKHIVLTKVVSEQLPFVEGDPQRLHQVLSNVLANAIKFTPEGGRIAIEAGRKDREIEIAISDSGTGIAPEFLPFVFDRFRQADSRATRQHGGLGLGLAIARHLLELHGGAIQAQSDGPGCGTTVTMRLPIRAFDQTPAARVGHELSEDEINLRLDGSVVVVVDDQGDSRELLAALFEHCGARVVRCECVADALAALKRASVDLLVADLAMPDVDGYELIRQVRRLGLELPAVAVSAFSRFQDRSRALEAGYSAYCAKPLDVRPFLQTVRELIPGS